MGKHGSVARSDVLRAIAAQLAIRVNGYLEKKQRFQDELDVDLEQLYSAYGTEIVKKIIEQGGVNIRKPRNTASEPGAEPPVTRRRPRDLEPAAPPTSGGAKKGSIAELTPVVKEIVHGQFKGRDFLVTEVCEVLEARQITFDASHVSYILRGMWNNDGVLEVVSKKVGGNGGGPSRNIYRIKEPSSNPA